MFEFTEYSVHYFICIAHFADPQGGFFYTPDTAQLLVARIRDRQDTVTPSGNGVMARVLSQLYYATGEERYAKYAQALFDVFADDFESGSFLLASVLDAHQFKALAVQVTIVARGRICAPKPCGELPSTVRPSTAPSS